MVEVHLIYLYEVRVHPVCEGFLLDSLIFTCGGWREGRGEKGKKREGEEEEGKRGRREAEERIGYRKEVRWRGLGGRRRRKGKL